MALRIIRKTGDEALKVVCKEVTSFNAHLHQLLDDMKDTMIDADGVGLAAPQVGVIKRAIVFLNGEEIMEMINPVITSQSGSCIDNEGCLSVPNVSGKVDRPTQITVDYQTRYGEKKTMVVNGFTARIICHETDHLNGVLFIEKAFDIEHR